MNREPKEENKIDFDRELTTLAEALYKSEYQDIVLYEEDGHFTGKCDGQIYSGEVKDIADALLLTGVVQEDDMMPLVISSNLRDSTSPSYQKVLENRCILGDCWEISLSLACSKDFKRSSYPVLKIKYCNNPERSAIVTKEWQNMFMIQKEILMRRLMSSGNIRLRVQYNVGEWA